LKIGQNNEHQNNAHHRKLSNYQKRLYCLEIIKKKEDAEDKILKEKEKHQKESMLKRIESNFFDENQSIESKEDLKIEKEKPLKNKFRRRLTPYQRRIACLKKQTEQINSGSYKENEIIQCETSGLSIDDINNIKSNHELGYGRNHSENNRNKQKIKQSLTQNEQNKSQTYQFYSSPEMNSILINKPYQKKELLDNEKYHNQKNNVNNNLAIDCSQFDFGFHSFASSSINSTHISNPLLKTQIEQNELWEQPYSLNRETKIAQMQRITIANYYVEKEFELATKVLGENDDFNTLQQSFDLGSEHLCKDPPLQRIRYTSSEWCEAALSGPGGIIYNTQVNEEVGEQKDRGSDESDRKKPLGVWCALPKKGTFVST